MGGILSLFRVMYGAMGKSWEHGVYEAAEEGGGWVSYLFKRDDGKSD